MPLCVCTFLYVSLYIFAGSCEAAMLPGSIEKFSYQTTENITLVELSQGTVLMTYETRKCAVCIWNGEL